jgi:hypothetical protein
MNLCYCQSQGFGSVPATVESCLVKRVVKEELCPELTGVLLIPFDLGVASGAAVVP